MIKQLRPALGLLATMTILLGLVYPACVWFIGNLIFQHQATGSLVYNKGHVVGSSLIAQPFSAPRFFHPRPSATTGSPYQFLASGGSNMNPANPALITILRERVNTIKRTDAIEANIPADLVTASGSGLDPHISPEAARLQSARVAQERGLTTQELDAIIAKATEPPTFGLLGQERINVLPLNLMLDRLKAEDP